MSHRTRLGLPVRPGWLVREQVEGMPPDGSVHLLAFSEPVQQVSTGEFAAGYGRVLTEHLSGYEELDLRDVRLFGGRDAVLRRYRSVPEEGSPLTHLAAYLVDGGVGHVVTGTTASSGFAAVEGDLLGLLSEIGLDTGGVVERSAVGTPAVLPRPRPASPWSEPRLVWQESSVGGSAQGGKVNALPDLTGEELTALSQLLGADAFPFLDETDKGDLAGEFRAPVLRAAQRSLLARGLLAAGQDGSLSVDEELREAVHLVLDPDLVVNLESDREDSLRVAIAADSSRTVEVQRRSGPAYALAVGSTSDLVARIAELAMLAPAPEAPAGTSIVVPGLAIDRARAFLRTGDHDGAARELHNQPEVLAALAGARAFNRVRTVFRDRDVVRGGEIVWLQTDDKRIWRLEPIDAQGGDAPQVEVRPVGQADLINDLLALLP